MIVFGFYIPELQRRIYLDMYEIIPFLKYLKKEIGWNKFYKQAREILLMAGVPRSKIRFTALRILYFIESGQYDVWEIEEEELPKEVTEVDKYVKESLREIEEKEVEYCKVRCQWHARLEYCEKSAHHLVIEAVVVFEYTIPKECFEDRKGEIESYIDNKLFNALCLFLDSHYVLIYSDYDSGIVEHDCIETFLTKIGTELTYDLIDASIYIGRNCAYSPEWRDDLSSDWEVFVDSYIDEIVTWIEALCGVRWV